jgi:Ca2+-binding RTX toxin-like protein
MAGPTAEEQFLLELTNDVRMNPLADTARYVSSYSPLVSSQPDIQAALNYFGVNGAALQAELAGLTPAAPLAWSENLSASAHAHDQAMLTADVQSHQVAGEADLGARATAAGYAGWSTVGENVYAYADNPLFAQAGFVVDWGSGANGIQSPPGHLENIMNPAYREVGIAVIGQTNPAAETGPELVTEDFGARYASTSFVLGVAYTDLNGDDFYEPGEATPGLTVSLGGAAVQNWASGGYTLETAATGAQILTFTGGGLAAPVTAAVTLAPGGDVKIDIVNGDELKTSASAVVSGPVSRIEGLGEYGLTLQATGSGPQVVVGAAGSDSLVAGYGSDSVLGLDGNDTIAGGSGGDLVNGNRGDDLIHGWAGNSTLFGGQGQDTLYGDSGADFINGNIGDDLILGGAGASTLHGGQGSDTIYGGAAGDVLSGDLGADVLYGRGGADSFVFVKGGGADWIGDFNAAEGDRIDLPTGTAYTVTSVSGQVVLDLGGGDTIGLVGVPPSAFSASWVVFS